MDFYNLEELDERARAVMPKMSYDYYAGAANTKSSALENRTIWGMWRLLPRVLVDVSEVDPSLDILGYRSSMPVMIAPSAMHGLAHPDKEVGTARAAATAGIPMMLSTMATTSLTDVAAQSDHPCLLFQLYVIRDRRLVEQWVRQAEAAGYKAILVTVDAPRLAKREDDERNRFCLPQGLQLANLAPLEARAATAHEADLSQARAADAGSALAELFRGVDASLTWEFLPWLRSITTLPVWVKGVLAPADAELAVRHGASGIVVSNHGGRQLDYAPTALQVLPAVVAQVAGRVPVWVDGGVRRGTDVLKALALGAEGVLIGRPVLYALAVGGQEGVEKALALLREEVQLAMMLAGVPRLADIGRHLLLPAPGVCRCGLGGGWADEVPPRGGC